MSMKCWPASSFSCGSSTWSRDVLEGGWIIGSSFQIQIHKFYLAISDNIVYNIVKIRGWAFREHSSLRKALIYGFDVHWCAEYAHTINVTSYSKDVDLYIQKDIYRKYYHKKVKRNKWQFSKVLKYKTAKTKEKNSKINGTVP